MSDKQNQVYTYTKGTVQYRTVYTVYQFYSTVCIQYGVVRLGGLQSQRGLWLSALFILRSYFRYCYITRILKRIHIKTEFDLTFTSYSFTGQPNYSEQDKKLYIFITFIFLSQSCCEILLIYDTFDPSVSLTHTFKGPPLCSSTIFSLSVPTRPSHTVKKEGILKESAAK